MGMVNIASGAVVGNLVEVKTVLTPAATVSVDASLASTYTLTPAQAETLNAVNVTDGSRLNLVVVTSGTTAYVVTFGTNFKSTGTLSTGTTSGATFVISFIGVGTNLVEVSRTTAQ